MRAPDSRSQRRWLALLACSLVVALGGCERPNCAISFGVFEPGATCWTNHFGTPPWIENEGRCCPACDTLRFYAYEGACWYGTFCPDPDYATEGDLHRMPPDVEEMCARVFLENERPESCDDNPVCQGRLDYFPRR